MFGFVGKLFSKKETQSLEAIGASKRQFRRIKASYDAAQTTDDNTKHWAAADGLDADTAASPSVRQTLRRRCRYEYANNCYARGMVNTKAQYVVGTGPRLQMLLPDSVSNGQVEASFGAWAKEIRLAAKLRAARGAISYDGEAFLMLISNPALRHPVKLDIAMVDADRVTSPNILPGTAGEIDGIKFDDYGNPATYNVLKKTPGQLGIVTLSADSDPVPASDMIHLYNPDRPEQHRGIPELTPALGLFSQLRRYTIAVLSAAETAADFALVMQTDAPADGDADSIEAMDTIQLERNMMTTMPAGWKLGQVDATQPSTTYGDFKREILGEVGRAFGMPFGLAAGNFSKYNYASGRLDHQAFAKAIDIERADMGGVALDRILSAWIDEAALIEGLLPQPLRTLAPLTYCAHEWFWDGREHVDPQKEATAQGKRLANGTTTLAAEYARRGLDWEPETRQRVKELTLLDTLQANRESERMALRKKLKLPEVITNDAETEKAKNATA